MRIKCDKDWYIVPEKMKKRNYLNNIPERK
jgi:hypothetical protein